VLHAGLYAGNHPWRESCETGTMNRLRFVPLALIVACGPPPPSRAAPGERCLAAPIPCSGGRTVESCCASTTCVYRVSDGTDFPCAAMADCNMAAMQLAAACR
jgi:hypothetical protein